MKKAILGTTALVAASVLVAGSVSASEKIKLGVGGYMQSTYYYADYDDNKVDGVERIDDRVTQEGEIHFKGETTLDNGVKFGVQVQLEAYEATDQVDETYIYVEGSFGRALIGSENSAAYLMHYDAPSPVPMYSGDSPNIYPIGTTATTRATMFSDADKITYFTPRFVGLQLGASYVPDGSSETGQHSAYAPTQVKSGINQGYSIAANYVDKVGAFSVAVSAGYESGATSGSIDPITAVAYAAATQGQAAVEHADASADYVAASADYVAEAGNILDIGTDYVAASGNSSDAAYGDFNPYNGRGYTAEVGYQAEEGVAQVGTAEVLASDYTIGTDEVLMVDSVAGSGYDMEDQTAFTLGTQIGYAGFKLGGGYSQVSNIGGIEDYDRETWSAGLTYGQGPWSVGVQYSEREDELNSLDLGTLETWTIGGKYALGPGITAFGGVQFYDNDLSDTDGDGIGLQEESTVVFVGTSLSF